MSGPGVVIVGPEPTYVGHDEWAQNLFPMYDHGRLGGSGYLSILPVDQGVEHSGAVESGRVVYE